MLWPTGRSVRVMRPGMRREPGFGWQNIIRSPLATTRRARHGGIKALRTVRDVNGREHERNVHPDGEGRGGRMRLRRGDGAMARLPGPRSAEDEGVSGGGSASCRHAVTVRANRTMFCCAG
ncbi:hypothetical protein [Nocardia sp. NPDC019304]|uniref:hypothetical protein n=1 Tax=unclassified Nocardia TaxID=2637762 RepID=UPI0033E6EE8C